MPVPKNSIVSFTSNLPEAELTMTGISMPSAKTAILFAFVPGSNPAAMRSDFLTRYQPAFVTMTFAFDAAARLHCCARRVASGAVAEAGVTPMPGSVVKMPPTEPRVGSGSVTSVPFVVVETRRGVRGPCIVWTPLRSTSSMKYWTKPSGAFLSTKR